MILIVSINNIILEAIHSKGEIHDFILDHYYCIRTSYFYAY